MLGERHGAQLKGGYLKVLDSENHEFRIHFTNVSDVVRFWVGASDVVQTYELEYTEEPVPTKLPLCANPPRSTAPA